MTLPNKEFRFPLQEVKYGLWTIVEGLVLRDRVSLKRMFCPDIWIYFLLNDKRKKRQCDFLHRVENQLKRFNHLAPEHCQCFKETAFKWRIIDSLISGIVEAQCLRCLSLPFSLSFDISHHTRRHHAWFSLLCSVKNNFSTERDKPSQRTGRIHSAFAKVSLRFVVCWLCPSWLCSYQRLRPAHCQSPDTDRKEKLKSSWGKRLLSNPS